jgi:monooxygenase
VPAMAERAAHVTMLQRSPSYVVARPSRDASADWLRDQLPERLAHGLLRWKNALQGAYYYALMRARPQLTKRALIGRVCAQLGPGYDVATHFTPRYHPWDQRLCLVPDGDLFAAIRSGRASVVTDQIDAFTPTGLRLRSGQELAADIVVTATGLVMRLMSGVQLVVDGRPVELARTLIYKGAMFSDLPNFAAAIGYTNASWTLKCELIARYVARLLNYMDRHGYVQCTPRRRDPSIAGCAAIGLSSGYVQRALPALPKQGSRRPWRLYQNYILDTLVYRLGRLDDGTLELRRQGQAGTSARGGMV